MKTAPLNLTLSAIKLAIYPEFIMFTFRKHSRWGDKSWSVHKVFAGKHLMPQLFCELVNEIASPVLRTDQWVKMVLI